MIFLPELDKTRHIKKNWGQASQLHKMQKKGKGVRSCNITKYKIESRIY